MITEELERLQTNAWRTAGARFNAARRLRRRDFFSTVSMAFFSAATIAVAFCQKMYIHPGSPADEFLTAFAVCLGVFLLAVSLIEWGSANGAKSEKLHKSAEELNHFYWLVKIRKEQQMLCESEGRASPSDWKGFEDLVNEYKRIKEGSFENHSPLDDALFRSRHRHSPEFKSHGEEIAHPLLTGLVWTISSVWFFLILWILVVAMIVYAFHLSPDVVAEKLAPSR